MNFNWIAIWNETSCDGCVVAIYSQRNKQIKRNEWSLFSFTRDPSRWFLRSIRQGLEPAEDLKKDQFPQKIA